MFANEPQICCRWSDGSTSLYLGSEIFDVHKQSLHGDFNHMFIRQGTGLQGQAIFRTKLSFRPHSTESKTHQKMTRQMADRSQKSSGIKVISQVPQLGGGEGTFSSQHLAKFKVKFKETGVPPIKRVNYIYNFVWYDRS